MKRERHHKAIIFFFFLSNSKINSRWRNSNNTEFKADTKKVCLWARKVCCIRLTRYEALLLPRGWDEMNIELKFLNASHFYEHFNYSKVEKLTRLKETDQQHNEKKREGKREGLFSLADLQQDLSIKTNCTTVQRFQQNSYRIIKIEFIKKLLQMFIFNCTLP